MGIIYNNYCSDGTCSSAYKLLSKEGKKTTDDFLKSKKGIIYFLKNVSTNVIKNEKLENLLEKSGINTQLERIEEVLLNLPNNLGKGGEEKTSLSYGMPTRNSFY